MSTINVKIKEFLEGKKGDLLSFNGQEWVPFSSDELLKNLTQIIKEQKEQIKILRNNIEETKKTLQDELNNQRQAIAELLKGIVK
jgi:gas vesicle protein